MNDGDCGERKPIVINSVREPPTSTPPHHHTTDANLGHSYMTGWNYGFFLLTLKIEITHLEYVNIVQ